MNRERLHSIVTKYMVCFLIVILATLAAFAFVYDHAYRLAQKSTYEKLQSQAEAYLQSFDTELSHVRELQSEFFSDRKLVFIIGQDMNLSDYEKRDCLLSVKERIDTVTGVSNLVTGGIVYLPKSGYKILPAAVYRMYDDDLAQMKRYVGYADDRMHFDGENFFIVKTGALKINSASLPNHVFVLQFSKAAIVRNLSVVNTSEESGAFWYDEAEDVLIEHSSGDYAGEKLVKQLIRNEDGGYESVQRLNADGKKYLVLVGGYGELGLFVHYEQEEKVMISIYRFRTVAFIVLAALTLLAVCIGIYSVYILHQPINVLLAVYGRVEHGNWKEHIKEERKDEFRHLYKGFNDMEDQIDRLINEVYVQTNLTQRAQMKQLQAQIAPHFLYNSFFVLSRRIKRGDYENAELLAKHLGGYFQYLTRNESDEMPLRREADHARSYAAIQDARFSRREEPSPLQLFTL